MHCAYCDQSSTELKRCSGCKSVYYCGRPCQKAHRKQHKSFCVSQQNQCRVDAEAWTDLNRHSNQYTADLLGHGPARSAYQTYHNNTPQSPALKDLFRSKHPFQPMTTRQFYKAKQEMLSKKPTSPIWGSGLDARGPCSHCFKWDWVPACPRCQCDAYCSVECQQQHWWIHQHACIANTFSRCLAELPDHCSREEQLQLVPFVGWASGACGQPRDWIPNCFRHHHEVRRDPMLKILANVFNVDKDFVPLIVDYAAGDRFLRTTVRYTDVCHVTTSNVLDDTVRHWERVQWIPDNPDSTEVLDWVYRNAWSDNQNPHANSSARRMFLVECLIKSYIIGCGWDNICLEMDLLNSLKNTYWTYTSTRDIGHVMYQRKADEMHHLPAEHLHHITLAEVTIGLQRSKDVGSVEMLIL